MKKIAVIDIGSNSVRIIIANVISISRIQIIDEIKETLRLGKDTDIQNNISDKKIETTVNTLKIFKGLCEKLEVSEIIAVATEAIRRAPNKDLILSRIFNATGITIKILTGDEEAYYDYLGVVNSISHENALILDIGGCSSEFINMKNKNILNKISLPYGALCLTDSFKLFDKVSALQKVALENFLIEKLRQVPWLKNSEFNSLIGIGGSFRTLGNIHRKNFSKKNSLLHGYKIPANDVLLIFSELITKNLEQRAAVKGLSKERADIFLASLIEIYTIINLCNIKEIIFSTQGLREGLIHEYVVQYFLKK